MAKNNQHEEEEDSEEFEVININPNVNYETDESDMCDADPVPHVEVKVKNVDPRTAPIEDIKVEKEEEKLCWSATIKCEDTQASVEDDNSNDSIDSQKKVRRKLNFQEYQKRRANEVKVEKKPLFDVPRRVAAYELCDAATLPMIVLPTDPRDIAMLCEPPNSDLVERHFTYNPAVYEEITIVSVGCNTEVSIPPVEEKKILTNIVNNHQLLNSSTSLFSSIQAVVQGKCVKSTSDASTTTTTASNEHGEDKTIMHLRKDRLRPFKITIDVQTEDISLFPPLLLLPSQNFNRIRSARNYRRKFSRSRSRSRSFSPVRYNNSRYSRSQHSAHSSSMNSSSDDSESDSDSSACSSSEDSLRRFNDRQNFRFYNRNQRDQNYQGE
jgi:hypothetical protein